MSETPDPETMTMRRWFTENIDSPRPEWPSDFSRVIEAFETREDFTTFESGGRYPQEYTPFVLHGEVKAPLRESDDREYSWYVLVNPWPGTDRTAWIVDGEPLLHEETVHGAENPDTDLIASDDDLIDVFPFRVVVCVALTKVASFHSRRADWFVDDAQIKQQFRDVVLPELKEIPGSTDQV